MRLQLLASPPDHPPVESLLEVDFYKLTMGQFVFHRYRGYRVRYAFILRTKGVHLAQVIPIAQLREAIAYARTLKLTAREIHYLRGVNVKKQRMFQEDYIDFLADLRLCEVSVAEQDGNFRIEVAGLWEVAIYWETLILNIVNELYYRNLTKNLSRFEREAVYARGMVNLAEKIKRLKTRPWITFADFGNRRRWSGEWQRQVDETLAAELPEQFRGTSNTLIAMELGVEPIGTNAHELPMALEALLREQWRREGSTGDHVAAAQQALLEGWWQEYGHPLSIALTDTFGTPFFLKTMKAEQAAKWKGFRQDSGDPIAIGHQYLDAYRGWGIDPATKLFLPSDGLDVDAIFRIDDEFGRGTTFKISYGWGTTLTNDLGFKPLSMVMKLVEIDGIGTVKLSDNLEKATGRPKDISLVKKAVGYDTTFRAECKV